VHAVQDLLAVQAVLDAQRVLQIVVVQVVEELPVDCGVDEGLAVLAQ
jgi:hypothetical protein